MALLEQYVGAPQGLLALLGLALVMKSTKAQSSSTMCLGAALILLAVLRFEII
ncbi:hypothetical protein ACF07L_38205 [Streptomyces anulatus]|uniref:hypothetical protein n=1 Tax=Streptomyces TaxID=1883 RepID=UPI0036FD6C03